MSDVDVLSVECPKCGVGKYTRCFNLLVGAWADQPHRERVELVESSGTTHPIPADSSNASIALSYEGVAQTYPPGSNGRIANLLEAAKYHGYAQREHH